MLHKITFWLLVIGGLNWLVFGILSYDIGSLLGGMGSIYARIIYIVVGLAAIYELVMHAKTCKMCGKTGMPMQQGE